MKAMLYLCLNSSFPFYVSKRIYFERKAKIAFSEDCFDTWMILVFIYCG